jgi:hypothetical protein
MNGGSLEKEATPGARNLVWNDWLLAFIAPSMMAVYHLPSTMINRNFVFLPVALFFLNILSSQDNYAFPIQIVLSRISAHLPENFDTGIYFSQVQKCITKAYVIASHQFPDVVSLFLPQPIWTYFAEVAVALFVLFTARRFQILSGRPPSGAPKVNKFLLAVCPSAQVWLLCDVRWKGLLCGFLELLLFSAAKSCLSCANFVSGVIQAFPRTLAVMITESEELISSIRFVQYACLATSLMCLIARILMSVVVFRIYK